MEQSRYAATVKRFAGRKVVVLGDLMLDEYLWGRATRISPESPVMVVEVDRESCVPGGAANVVNNLLSLGARVSVLGVVGDDAAGIQLASSLSEQGADVRGIVTSADRPTTRKTRVVAHSQQVLRVDREQARPIDDALAARLMAALDEAVADAEAVLVSDYNKGVLVPAVAARCVAAARARQIPVTANPKPSTARLLAGATALQLNQSEAEAAMALGGISAADTAALKGFDEESRMERVGLALAEDLGVETVVVTRGAKGIALWWRDGRNAQIPAHPVEVYDVAGAGDTVISTLTLALAAGATIEEAAAIANHAGACVVRKLGVATVTPDELLADC